MQLARVAPPEARSRAELIADLDGHATRSAQTVELGLWIGLLTADLELSDYGMALRWLAENRTESTPSGQRLEGVAELLLWLLIRADSLLVALMVDWVASSPTGSPRLESALDLLISAAKAEADPDQLMPAPHLVDFLHSLDATPDRGQEALRARLEMFGYLGMAQSAGSTENESALEPSNRLLALMSGLKGSSLSADVITAFLDRQYFRSLLSNSTRAPSTRPSREQILLWLADAYHAIERPLGFTPGRPISLLACCLAARTGTAMDIHDAYDCIYEAAGSRWADHLHFSGGSRFDREFLIRIDPSLRNLLESEIAKQ